MKGKAIAAQNAVTHGLYGSVLQGKDLVRLKKVREFSTGEVLQSNFEMIQAKLLGCVEGDVRIPKKFEQIYGMAEMMAEDGEFSQEDLQDLKMRLSGADIDKILRVSVGSTALVGAARAANQHGDIVRQNSILQEFVIRVMRSSQDKSIREMAVQAIARLKLDAGLPVEALESLIVEMKEEEAKNEEPVVEDPESLLEGAIAPEDLEEMEDDLEEIGVAEVPQTEPEELEDFWADPPAKPEDPDETADVWAD